MGEHGLFTDGQLAATGDPHQHGFGGILTEFWQSAVGNPQPANCLGINQNPPSGTRNTDAHHIKSISIQCAQHTGRSEAGHPVLATGSPENHRQAVTRTIDPMQVRLAFAHDP